MAGGAEYSKGAHLTIKNKHVADIFLLKRAEKRRQRGCFFISDTFCNLFPLSTVVECGHSAGECLMLTETIPTI